MSATLRPPGEEAAPPPMRGMSWLRRFLSEQTFSPEFFPSSLRHPVIGYLIALLVQVIMVLLIALLTQSFLSFRFIEAPLLFAVLIVALGWGVGPSVLAALFGALLLVFLALPPYFSLRIEKEDVVGLTLYVILGLTVSVVASQTQRARRVASERAGQLEAILEGMTDGVFIIDADRKNALHTNSAARDLLNLSHDVRTGQLFENGRPFDLYDEYDQLIPYEQWPQEHILAGEVLQGAKAVDVVMRTYDARKLYLNVTGAPVYTTEGKISSAVLVCRDVTERRLLEQRVLASERAASERARQLEATFDAMVDGVLVYDAQGRVLRMNSAYQKMIALEAQPEHLQLSPQERGTMLQLRDEQGNILTSEQMPVQRMLAGDMLTADRSMDIRLRALDGREVQLNITGRPLYEQGQLAGGVLIFRDVTERRALERRTQQALQALLMMAEEVVRLPDTSGNVQSTETLSYVGKRLAGLICQVLSCQRVSLTMIDAKTQTSRSLAVVGLSPQQEQLWLERESGMSIQEQVQGTPIEASLRSNEVQVIDFTQPPLRDRPNPYGLLAIVLAPMKVGEQRIGMLAIDYGSVQHTYPKEELALIQAVADLAALVLERERLLAERADAQANVLAAQEANRLMEEFIGIAGHELRTPLTTIKASVQLAKRQVERLQQQGKTSTTDVSKAMTNVHDFLERTERQVGMQNRLISDLLDVSRIQTGRLELHPELHDIIVLVRQVVEDQRYLTPDRRLTFESTIDGEVLVLADADRVRQVVTNYLSNALKYSAADKAVAVRIALQETWVRVAVCDEGPGLDENQLQQVWERFYRVPGIEVKSGSGVGLGLGLHISRMIIERQGGKVGVESLRGAGSTFWFMLPLAEH